MSKTPVYMPKFGMTMIEAEIIHWHVEQGRQVSKGDPLVAIETEKTNVDIESPGDGYVGALLFEEGDLAEVGTVVVHICGSEAEAAEDSASDEPAAPAASTAAPTPAPAGKERPMPRIRRIIADNMRSSLQHSAQLTLFREMCVDSMVACKRGLSGVSYNDILLKALALAAVKYPKVLDQLSGDTLTTKDSMDLGLAVALDDGLIVPVIRGVDKLSLTQIAAERKRLTEAARGSGLSAADTGGAIGTLSNLGLQDIDCFTPILNLPESFLLGVGAIRRKPWVKEESLTVANVTTFSITFDHQVLDGRDAAEFLGVFADILESPEALS